MLRFLGLIVHKKRLAVGLRGPSGASVLISGHFWSFVQILNYRWREQTPRCVEVGEFCLDAFLLRVRFYSLCWLLKTPPM